MNISGLQFNTVHANDFQFYEELNEVVQHEPADFFDPETVGLFASIGIKKGKPFAPDARMKAILTDAVAVGNAAARAIVFASRDPRTKFYPDRQWTTGSSAAATSSRTAASACSMRAPCSTTTPPASRRRWPAPSPALARPMRITARDSQGRYLDGSKTYKVTLPAPIPAASFWSFTVYDNQTRSMLETDQTARRPRQQPARR